MRPPICIRCNSKDENMIAINVFFGSDQNTLLKGLYVAFQCKICGEVIIKKYEI